MTTPLAPQAVIEASTEKLEGRIKNECMGSSDSTRGYIKPAALSMVIREELAAMLSAAKDMGWMMVPIEPTEKMELAALEANGEKQKETHDEYEGSTLVDLGMCKETAEMLNIAACENYRKIYSAMLAAANGEG